MLKDTLTPCHSSHLGCCSAFQDGDGTLLGRVGLAPGLVPCQVVLRGRMDALGAMAALTLRSSRELRGQGLRYSAPRRSAPYTDSWSKHVVLRSISEKPRGRMAQWLGLPLLLWGWCCSDLLGEKNT